MRTFFWKIRAAICHARGLFALNEGRLERAESLLRESIRLSEKFPNPILPETYLLLANTVERLARRAEAVELFRLGMAEVRECNQLTVDDENYLGTYFCLLFGFSEEAAAFESFDIAATKKWVRRDFPMIVGRLKQLPKLHRLNVCDGKVDIAGCARLTPSQRGSVRR